MQHILLVVWGDIHYGGVQLLLLNLFSSMDRSNLKVDLYCFGKVDSEKLFQEFMDLGFHIITGNHSRYDTRDVFRDLNKLIKENRYDAVHCNTGGIPLTAAAMFAAWLHRVPIRIAHSHNSKPDDRRYSRRERLYQHINSRLSTVRLTCSQKAAQHLFGAKAARKAVTLKNGIIISKYRFDPLVREQLRKKLGIEDKFVIGHVGRFDIQKNHKFLIEVFAAVARQRSDAVLMLIGEGPLCCEVQRQAEQIGLKDKVLFVGLINNVCDYLQAMDLFVLPSLFEGLPIVQIEAQTADLPVVCSDEISSEAVCTPKVKALSLEKSPQEWSEAILSMHADYPDRGDCTELIRKAGFDINSSAAELHRLYVKNGVKK